MTQVLQRMEEQVLAIMKRVFENPSLDTSCSQTNCKKWDSMNHLNLIVELEIEFGVSFEPEEIAQMVNFVAVCEILRAKGAG